ncbi:hypothetical protein GCM10027265_32580 [Jatrophihabitans fulvus]
MAGGSTAIVAVGAAPASAACAPDPGTAVKQTGISYLSTGSAAGKRNGSTQTSTLSVSLSLTKTQSSAWQVGGGASVDFGVAKVEANTNYTVTRTTAVNKTVTDTVSVPGHYYGYAQPKAEVRTFHIYNYETTPQCGYAVTHDYGYFDAITAAPFFAECVATSPCTPKP